MAKYVLNAFSLNMLSQLPASIEAVELTETEAAEVSFEASGVGHADTAVVFSSVLGTEVPMNRTTVSLVPGDQALVGQYKGPRLAEGTTCLPEGATIQWLLVTVK